MRSAIRWLVGAGIVVAVIGAWRYRPQAWAPRPAAEIAAGDSSDLVVGEPIRFKNLTIFPVTSTVSKDQDRFITLAEGLKSGLVRISEVGVQQESVANHPAADDPLADDPAADDSRTESAFDATPLPATPVEAPADARDPLGDNQSATAATDAASPLDGESASPPASPLAGMGSTIGPVQSDVNRPAAGGEIVLTSLEVDGNVNQLLVTNSSDRPLYLMPGEILVGGKQDRTIADELVVAPHTERMPINVFCVEHGRWSPRTSEESAALAMNLSDSPGTENTPPQSAAGMAGGAFSQAGGYLNKKCRLTVQASKDQSDVWDEVRSVNAMTCPTTDSGAFTANYADVEVTGKLEPYVAAMEKAVADRPQVVGVIVAVNGEIQAADTFESTPLFRKLWPKLLKSYVLDAVAQADDGQNQAPICDVAQAKAFLRDAIEAKVAATNDRDGLVTTRGDAQTVACFSLHESSASRPAGSVNGSGDEEGMGGMGGGIGGGMGGSFGSGVHSAAFSK